LGPWLLPPRGAVRVRGDRGLGARDVFAVLRFPCFMVLCCLLGRVSLHVRDARLPHDDALLLL